MSIYISRKKLCDLKRMAWIAVYCKPNQMVNRRVINSGTCPPSLLSKSRSMPAGLRKDLTCLMNNNMKRGWRSIILSSLDKVMKIYMSVTYSIHILREWWRWQIRWSVGGWWAAELVHLHTWARAEVCPQVFGRIWPAWWTIWSMAEGQSSWAVQTR